MKHDNTGRSGDGDSLAYVQSGFDDPYAWLEDIHGDEAMNWVRERNSETARMTTRDDGFEALRTQLREVLDSADKIPPVVARGRYLYNFWTDVEHPRGIWRRTTMIEYGKDRPEWELLLDIDALNESEGEDWVWHGAALLRPHYDRALVALSHGGSDSDVTREFDLATKAWAPDGFYRPESKGGLGWIDSDTVFAYTDTGLGSMTTSGYPRTVRRWQRGTALADAELIFESAPEILSASAVHDSTPGFERDLIVEALTFYSSRCYLLTDGGLVLVPVPESAEIGIKREWLLIQLRDPWVFSDRELPAGALLAIRFDDFMAGGREFAMLYEPDGRSSLAGTTWTRSHLVVNIMRDVRNQMQILDPPSDGVIWTSRELAVPEFGTSNVRALDSDESDALWLVSTDFLTPTTISLINCEVEVVKTMPTFFGTEGLVIEQSFAASKDGTRVPYFLVRSEDLPFDGEAPTLLYGYGGFEVSLTPAYSGTLGRAWLSRGGVYALANIRGGGEYGPSWHQAALTRSRHRAFEDFAAVGQDLIARKVTSPRRLGVQGGSNGGLLTGNMLVSYPELFGAIVIQVPLLDMRRYAQLHAGASWMAEYGDPEVPEQWAFIQEFSPYHLAKAGAEYPPVLMTTSTRDDRVHPGHARKMTALLSELGHDVSYYENIEGGHGGSADNEQAAYMSALAYAFLWEKLRPAP